MINAQFVSFVFLTSFCQIFLFLHFFMISTNEERLSIFVIMCNDESNLCSAWNIDDEWAKMHNDVCVNNSDCLWQQQKVDLENFLYCSLFEKLRIEFSLENDILSKFQKQKKIWVQNFVFWSHRSRVFLGNFNVHLFRWCQSIESKADQIAKRSSWIETDNDVESSELTVRMMSFSLWLMWNVTRVICVVDFWCRDLRREDDIQMLHNEDFVT